MSVGQACLKKHLLPYYSKHDSYLFTKQLMPGKKYLSSVHYFLFDHKAQPSNNNAVKKVSENVPLQKKQTPWVPVYTPTTHTR